MLFSFSNVICFTECILARMSFVFLKVQVNKRNNTNIFFKYIFMLKPKQLFIIIYVNVYVKRVSPHKTNNNLLFRYGKIPESHFPSHDRVCDDRIRHWNHMRSLIVLSTKVTICHSEKFEFSQERRCHGSVKMTVSEWWVWFSVEWLTRPLQTTLMCLE